MAQAQGLKDRELQDYYEALFAMYGTPGWQELMRDVEAMTRRHDTPRDITTVEELHQRRGELLQMDWLRTHQQRTEQAYTLLLEDEGAAADHIQTGGVAKVVESPEQG